MRRPLVAFGLAAGLYFLLTVALTWPLVLHPRSRVPNDLGDALLNMFLLAWDAREVPFTDRWWNLPQFYPVNGAMAFSEHLLGLAPLTAPVIRMTGDVVLAYNIAFFLSFPLCAAAAHLLALQLTRRTDVSVIAGLAYGFAPYRMSQFSHVQVLSAYWMPLALLGLHLFLERRQRRWLLLFAVSWYMQALTCGYYLFYLSVLVGLWLLWFAPRRLRRPDVVRLAAAWGAAAAALAPVALGYLRFGRAYGLRRWPDEIESFSADVASLLSASANLRLWGWLNVFERPESPLFPGVTIVGVMAAGAVLAYGGARGEPLRRARAPHALMAAALLAGFVAITPVWFGGWRFEPFGVRLLSVSSPQKPLSLALLFGIAALGMHPGIRSAWRRRSPLAFYTMAAAVMWLFSLGPSPTLMGTPLVYKAPYAWLLMVPGVDGIRVPARFWVLATLCMAVAAALAVVHLQDRWRRYRMHVAGAVCFLILAEAWPAPLELPSPPAPRPIRTAAVARLELPVAPLHDLAAVYRAAAHRRPLFNGYSGYFAPHYRALQDLLGVRDGNALQHLASFGAIEIVVDHAQDPDGGWRAFVRAQPGAEEVYQDGEHTVFRLPRSRTPIAVPRLTGSLLPIAAIRASTGQDRVDQMADGDLVSRWDTAGPQGSTHEVVVDLGRARTLDGIELLIAGYVADYPRELLIELSPDGAAWSAAWSGSTALMAFASALESPRTVPLRFPLNGREARYIRLRQTSDDPVYYWTIAELGVYGT